MPTTMWPGTLWGGGEGCLHFLDQDVTAASMLALLPGDTVIAKSCKNSSRKMCRNGMYKLVKVINIVDRRTNRVFVS